MIDFSCRLRRAGYLFDVSFSFAGRALALFGPSGSGKTTAARLIAGLERPDSGVISLNGVPLVDCARRHWTPPHKRRIGVVFQDALLFPHMNVKANLIYGRNLTPKNERRIALGAVIDVLGIGGLLERRPDSLSGGEKQRVAIGRALLACPRLLLFDEPLASLDIARKLEILPFIEQLRDEFHIPMIYISHAPEEIARIADWAIYLDHGAIAAQGAPADLPPRPGLAHGAARFDAISILHAVVARYCVEYCVTVLNHPAGDIIIPCHIASEQITPVGRKVAVVVSAANIALAIEKPQGLSIRTVLSAKVKQILRDDGPFALIMLELTGGETLKIFLTRMAADALRLSVGAAVYALIKTASLDERGVSSHQQPSIPERSAI